MTNTREEVAVAEAIALYMEVPEQAMRCAKAAIAASNSQYVPMLVEALKAINEEQSCGNYTAQEALNNLPEELRG